MNNLSEFFRSKLAGRTFHGKEKGWSEMEAMLDKAMPVKKKWYKRRGFFFWMTPIVGSLLLFSIFRGSMEDRPVFLAQSEQTKNHAQAKPDVNKGTSAPTEIPVSGDSHFSAVSSVNIKVKDPVSFTGSGREMQIVSEDREPAASNTSDFSSRKNPAVENEPPSALSSAMRKESTSNDVIPNKNFSSDYQQNALESSLPSLRFVQLSMIAPFGFKAMAFNESKTEVSPYRFMPNSLRRAQNLFYSISLSAGMIRAGQQALTMQQASDLFLQRRQNEERQTWLPWMGIDFKMHYHHFTFGSGVQIAQWGESRNYSDDFYKNLTVDSIQRTFVDNSYWQIDSTSFSIIQYSLVPVLVDTVITYYNSAEGVYVTTTIQTTSTNSSPSDTLVFYKVDSTFVQQGDSIVRVYQIEKNVQVAAGGTPGLKGRNLTTYAELPLMFGYEFRSRRWGLGIEAGVALGRLLRTRTIYLNPDESGLIQVSGDQFQQWLMNYQARINLSYRLNNGLRLELSPMMRRTAQGVFKNESVFQQRYLGIGGSIGLRYTW